MKPEVLILGYHKIGPPPPNAWASWYYTPAADFAAQLRWLREAGYVYLSAADFCQGIDDPSSLPAKSVLITFDDGYRSILRYGLPEMQAAQCPGVIFLPTRYVGGHNDFDKDEEPQEEILAWEEMAELETNGVAIQSHGVSHRAFSALSLEECAREIADSKALLEEKLHRPVELFSFPYGDPGGTPEAVAAVQEILKKAGYRAAFRYGPDPLPFSRENRFALGRIGLGSDTDLAAAVAAFPRS